jgi:hypothetical protein
MLQLKLTFNLKTNIRTLKRNFGDSENLSQMSRHGSLETIKSKESNTMLTLSLQQAWRKIGMALAVLMIFFASAEAQVAVVKRNVNLRRSPSANQPPIRLLIAPEELRLVTLARVNGYYHVVTDANEEGWVYSAFVEVDEGRPGAIVQQNTNLRRGASSSQPSIRLLLPQEELQVLDRTPVNGYYHVSTSAGEEGWVYGRHIQMIDLGPPTPTPAETAFPDAHDSPTPGWTGPVFKLSQNYPATPPTGDPRPWKNFDFKTQAEQYMRAVLAYALEGNLDIDWQVEKNTVRKWYHAPWLHATENGREFVHGLTTERSSRPRELHPNQTSTFVNYAVGIYNPIGGYVIGRVWRDHDNPDPAAARFPDGTVAVKLLFTTATLAQVPYLRNAFEWDAHIRANTGSSVRTIQKVRLLQIDIAVRDTRADNTTGWVFGTFAYDGNASGATPWQRMLPVGLMWGNDATLTPARFASGRRPVESVILNKTVGVEQHLGWLGRLNGPVDNPRSACLSCHATAQLATSATAAMVPGASLTDAEKMRWFRNIRAGAPFDAGQESLDYSLQLAVGINNFFASRRPPGR